MQLPEEDLSHITRLAAAAYTPAQVALALGIDRSDFNACMLDADDAVCIAYFTGLNSSELAVRESVLTLARSGSSPAQTLFMKLFDDTRKNLRIHGFAEE